MGALNSTPTNEHSDWKLYIDDTNNNRDRVYDSTNVLTDFDYNLSKKNIEIKEKKTYKLILPFVLEENFKKEKSLKNNKEIDFSFDVRFLNENECKISTYFIAKEIINKEGNFEGIQAKYNQESFVVTETNPNFKLKVNLDLIGIDRLQKETSDTHLIICLSSESSKTSLINHLNFEVTSDIKLIMIKRNFFTGKDLISLKPAFGLKNSPLFNEESNEKCIICITNPPTTMVEPCRHVCLCEECAVTLQNNSTQCPVCRGVFNYLVKLS